LTTRPALDREEDVELETKFALVRCFDVETDSVDEDDFGVNGWLGSDFMVSMH